MNVLNESHFLADATLSTRNHGVHGGLCPLPKISPNLFNPSFIVESGINYTKMPLSSGEEKHVDIVMNTTGNKARTKYSREVS